MTTNESPNVPNPARAATESLASEQKQESQPQVAATELRESIQASLTNVGVLAALMMALSGMIYVDPPNPPGMCFGDAMIKTEMVIVWMSMGFFFFSCISTVVLFMDLDGIPTSLLLAHLHDSNSQTLYSLPTFTTILGIIMTATAYSIDIGERAGCPFFVFGIIAAPCFVLSIAALWVVCRRRRQRLFSKHALDEGTAVGREGGNEGRRHVRASYLATWADRAHADGKAPAV